MKTNNYNNDDIKKYSKYLSIIDKSVDDMIKIINDILDIDRISSNQINLTIENILLDDFVNDIEFCFSKNINNLNIKFTIVKSYDNHNNIYSDKTRLKQIILNILSNSIKYSKSNQLNEISFSIIYNNNTNNIDFSIKDTGIGIKKDKITELMELKPSLSNNKNNSNGIGLYLCNKLALLLGGYISINSEYMKGTEFIFSHPIKLGYNNIINKKIENFNILSNILIVDNDNNIILLFRDIIQNLKFKYNINNNIIIDSCLSSSLVCDMITSNNYDIIFMDLYMTDINGITIAKLLRKQYYNKKIIGITTNIDDLYLFNKQYDVNLNNFDNKIKLFQLFDDIIIKPFTENDILDKLKY
jgi:CheY-like chemotaxis protein